VKPSPEPKPSDTKTHMADTGHTHMPPTARPATAARVAGAEVFRVVAPPGDVSGWRPAMAEIITEGAAMGIAAAGSSHAGCRGGHHGALRLDDDTPDQAGHPDRLRAGLAAGHASRGHAARIRVLVGEPEIIRGLVLGFPAVVRRLAGLRRGGAPELLAEIDALFSTRHPGPGSPRAGRRRLYSRARHG
jgi:hypothetical protein